MSDEFPDAGPHASPDQLRAALKRRDALEAAAGRKAEPEQRRASKTATTSASPRHAKSDD